MTEEIMKIVHSIRITIYLCLFASLAFISVSSYLHAEPIKEAYEETKAFWPPDMVPHPMPPEIPSKDDDMV